MFATEGEKLAGERGRAPRGFADFHDVTGRFTFRTDEIESEIAVTQDRGQKIIEVVRRTACELAEGVHFLRTQQLILQLFARSNVHERADELLRRSRGIADD